MRAPNPIVPVSERAGKSLSPLVRALLVVTLALTLVFSIGAGELALHGGVTPGAPVAHAATCDGKTVNFQYQGWIVDSNSTDWRAVLVEYYDSTTGAFCQLTAIELEAYCVSTTGPHCGAQSPGQDFVTTWCSITLCAASGTSTGVGGPYTVQFGTDVFVLYGGPSKTTDCTYVHGSYQTEYMSNAQSIPQGTFGAC